MIDPMGNDPATGEDWVLSVFGMTAIAWAFLAFVSSVYPAAHDQAPAHCYWRTCLA